MTLQERVLEALGEKALKPQALYSAMSGENVTAVDAALQALLKRGVVSFELGHYQRSGLTSKVVVAKMEATPAALAPASPLVRRGPGRPPNPTRCCKRCGVDKPLEEFPDSNLPGVGKLRTCRACMRRLHSERGGRPPKEKATETAPTTLARQPITVSARILKALEGRQMELAAAIEAAESDLASKREELLDLVQFLGWLETQTGRA
jgi:hypothetical protein